MVNIKLYYIWIAMKQRCYNANCKAFINYGQRGIKVCIRWRRSFKSFYNWAIKNGWKEGLSIDREDNNSNYTPSNCRFVTSTINQLNRRMMRNNTSGYTGVCKYMGGYIVRLRVNGQRKYLGYFKSIKKAAKTRDKYIIENNLSHPLSFN